MPSTYIIALIASIIIVSFIISAVSYSRQQALKKRNQMIRRYQQQADEALTFVSLLLHIDQEFDLIIQLQNLAVTALSSAYKLNPEDQMIINNLSTQTIKLKQYQANQRPSPVCSWLTSEAALKAAQSQLAQLNKLLDLYRNKGDLSFSKHQHLQGHINALHNKISTNSYLYQADLCAEQNNITSYQLYIKQAMQMIKKSMSEHNIKLNKIKELSERIQEVRRTGRANEFKNFIKPTDPLQVESQQEADNSE